MNGPTSMFPPPGATPVQLVRIMQIICGALVMGVVFFSGVVIFLRFDGQQRPAVPFPLVAYMAAGMAGTMVVLNLILAPLIAKSVLKQMTNIRPVNDLTKIDLYGAYQTKMIVGCALLEGAALFNVISFLIEGQNWTLAVVGLLLAMMAASFPTCDRVDGWAEEQLRQLQLNS